MALNTPKRVRTLASLAGSPPNCDYSSSPCPLTCGSPEFANNQQVSEKSENRRGRPRSEALTTLMIEGSSSPSNIKCNYCNRVFPREKSLQAHLRTHTGERPYPCDYPGCTRAFTQSGQLKTHQRLHTGERPFICSIAQCQQRFTHANRHCPDHPYDQLKRCDDFVIQAVSEQNSEVIKWLEKYRMEKEDRTPTRKTPKRIKSGDNNENFSTNETECPTTLNPYKSRKGLMVELDMNAGLEANSVVTKLKTISKVIEWNDDAHVQEEVDSGDEGVAPSSSTFNPKKRWLREAWQDDLAKPLEPVIVSTTTIERQINPNEMRPTVLMVASKDRTMPMIDVCTTTTDISHNIISTTDQTNGHVDQYSNSESYASDYQPNYESPASGNRKWLGALALMQLASEEDDKNIIQDYCLYPPSNVDRYTHL